MTGVPLSWTRNLTLYNTGLRVRWRPTELIPVERGPGRSSCHGIRQCVAIDVRRRKGKRGAVFSLTVLLPDL